MKFLTDDQLPPPPPTKERAESITQRRWREFAEELQANPGLWTKWPTRKRKLKLSTATQTAWSINKKHESAPAPFREDGFEAIVRNGAIYVRAVK